jgi:hypothetical protein
MQRRGVNYDVGIEFGEYHSRPVFDSGIARRELEIIRDELHCNAVRISGTDPDRLTVAARYALDLGMEVWLSPHLIDRSPQQTLDHIVRCAHAAQRLPRHRDAVVFVVGCELTLFMNGIIKGRTMMQRIRNPVALGWRLRVLGAHNKPLNAFLARACTAVREVFDGPLSYAAIPIEAVDWTLFDIIGVDYYRAARNRASYGRSLASLAAYGKPVVVTEVGLCGYRGAEDKGPHGFMIVEDIPDPPGLRLDGDYVRDEALQARELTDMLTILERAGVDGVFVFTFVTPALPHSSRPRGDLDLAGYGLVTSYTDHDGVTYPGLPWEPKQSFHAVADLYRALDGSAPGNR